MNKIQTKPPSQAIKQYSTVTNACKLTIQHQPDNALYVHSFVIVKHHNLIIVCIKPKEVKFSGAFAILRNVTVTFVMSACPSVHLHGTTQLPLDGFS